MTRLLLVAATLAIVACGGGKTPGPQPPPVGDDEVAVPPVDGDGGAAPTEPPAEELKAEAKVKADRAPELFAPAWTRVGVGQTISFAVTAIDQDLNETRVLVTQMPASARFDALTQTVTWTPTRKDLPAGVFVLEVATLGPDGQPTKTSTTTWEIAVDQKKQPPPVAPRQGAVVETLLTIREPDRLVQVNKDWPFDALLARSAELVRLTLPPEQQAKLPVPKPTDKKLRAALFRSFLKALAETHANPRLDPDAPEFDKKVFGDPKAWRIVAVRPRIDKKWTELRIVYQAVKAPEPVFAMFRVRPTWDVPTLPPEARAYNNKVFLELVWKHLLEDGAPSEAHLNSARKHGKAVAALVRDVLAYDDSATHPWARAAFLALPTEARMGGGSARHPDGTYRSGDGWAWGVARPLPTADGTAQAYVNIGIPGFWTRAVPSPDGTAWIGKCAPKFDPDDPKHTPGWEVLCRKAMGFVDLPEVIDGKVQPARRDAVNLFVGHKRRDSVEHLALDDGRRDHGEENGMTCAQCHIRNFGVRDYGDLTTADPRKGTPTIPNRAIPTLNFQIVPTTTWEAYTLDFMKDQECKGKAQIEQFLGKASGLTCPLAAATATTE